MTAYIAGYARTPFVKFTGQFATQPATVLGAHAVQAALSRAGVSPDQVDQVVGERFRGDFIVHRMQLLMQPHVERPFSRRIHFLPADRVGGPVVLRLVVICHGVLPTQRGALRGLLSEALISPREHAHVYFHRP